MIIYWTETYLLQKNKETQFSAAEKTRHEVDSEKPDRMFIFCEENIEECHNINLSNVFSVG